MRAVLAFLLGITFLLNAFAQEPWPARPVRFILPFPPGGGTDILGRMIAERLSASLGQPVVTENRGGAGGNVGAEAAAKSVPDGYTLVLVAPSLAISPTLYSKINYDPVKDFAPVSLVATVPNVMITQAALPVRTLEEFIAFAKARPGQVNFGSSGVGASPHLSVELFKSMARIDIVHVPYKGAALALSDVISGHIESSVGNLSGALLGSVKSGRVRALGVTAAKRSKHVPDVPTFAEAGVPGYDVSGWYGICTQAKVPQPVLAKLSADLHRILNDPVVRKRLEDQAVDVAPSTPEQFVAHVRTETEKWTKVVREAGLEER